MKFEAGNRVHIQAHWNWPTACYGFVVEPPDYAVRLVAETEPWAGCHRFVQGRNGLVEFVWVKFDESQYDGDGDGPYREGEVETAYLTLIR